MLDNNQAAQRDSALIEHAYSGVKVIKAGLSSTKYEVVEQEFTERYDDFTG